MIYLAYSTAAMLAGFALDALFGDPHGFPHIIRLMGGLIAELGKHLRRLLPKTEQGKKWGGIFLVCIVSLICAGVPLAALMLLYRVFPLFGFAVENFLCYQLRAAKSLKIESMKVHHSLQEGDTGEGKGKTTAAPGLMMRAYGRGRRIVLVQFLKGRDTGELHAFQKLDGITVLRNDEGCGFFSSVSEDSRAEMIRKNNANLAEAARMAREEFCDMLVLDEICAAYGIGAIDREIADRLVFEKPQGLELVLTGRNAPPHYIEIADYVTEAVKRKHPYDVGIASREGIEF